MHSEVPKDRASAEEFGEDSVQLITQCDLRVTCLSDSEATMLSCVRNTGGFGEEMQKDSPTNTFYSNIWSLILISNRALETFPG